MSVFNLTLLQLWARAVYRMRRRNATLWNTTRVLWQRGNECGLEAPLTLPPGWMN